MLVILHFIFFLVSVWVLSDLEIILIAVIARYVGTDGHVYNAA